MGATVEVAALSCLVWSLREGRVAQARFGYSLDREVSVLTESLAIGGRPDASLLSYRVPTPSAAAGRRVTHIINCLAADEEPAIAAAFPEAAGRMLTLGLADDADDARRARLLPAAV